MQQQGITSKILVINCCEIILMMGLKQCQLTQWTPLDSKTKKTMRTRFSQYQVERVCEPAVILAGKRCSCCHSTTGFGENIIVAVASYQVLKVLSFYVWERA